METSIRSDRSLTIDIHLPIEESAKKSDRTTEWVSKLPRNQSFEQLPDSANRHSHRTCVVNVHQAIDLSEIAPQSESSAVNSRSPSPIPTLEQPNRSNTVIASKSKAERFQKLLPCIGGGGLMVVGSALLLSQYNTAPSSSDTFSPLTIGGYSCLAGSAIACTYYLLLQKIAQEKKEGEK